MIEIPDYSTGEFKILVDEPITIQKWLNMWKHQFTIQIISVTMSGDKLVVILCRWEKVNA